MARKFKFKPAKVTSADINAALQRMGFDDADRCLIFSQAENDGGEFSDCEIEDAREQIKCARKAALAVQEDAQFEAWLAKDAA